MDPISILVTALVAGAAAGLQDTAAQAVKDGYNRLTSLFAQKYPDVDVAQLEKDPQMQLRQDLVKAELAKTAAPTDEELLREAQRLLETVKNQAPKAAQNVGISLEDVEAMASINIKDLIARGGSVDVKLKGVRAQQDINIGNLQTGEGQSGDPK